MNETVLFIFTTYIEFWPTPYYEIHGQILRTPLVNYNQRLHLK